MNHKLQMFIRSPLININILKFEIILAYGGNMEHFPFSSFKWATGQYYASSKYIFIAFLYTQYYEKQSHC